jgi:hypothetical protein
MMPPPDSSASPPAGASVPVRLVWPGEGYPQVWTLLWIGVAFLLAGLLPWGPGAREMNFDGVVVRIAPHDPHEPMGLARALVVLAAIGMIVHDTASIWRRTYTRGASAANLLGGLCVVAELSVFRCWEHLGPLLAEAGALAGTSEQRARFERIYLERGPGYYVAVLAATTWIFITLRGLVRGSRRLRQKEDERRAAGRAGAKAAAGASSGSPASPESGKA